MDYDLPIFQMKYLSEKHSEVFELLRYFTSHYEHWINKQESVLKRASSENLQMNQHNLEQCRAACAQMNKTIDLLENESHLDFPAAWIAFRFANRAMYLQRKQSLENEIINENNSIRWYPVQLAFILYELLSFIKPKSEERKTVELIWIPEGTGKTEAYLGISAFVIFLRRLRNVSDHGVTVIFKTASRFSAQQLFDRASKMIIACEIVRSETMLFGCPISIGLWIKDNTIPNNLKVAQRCLKKIVQQFVPRQNPIRINYCPWCGFPLKEDNYFKVFSNDDIKYFDEKRMNIKCSNPECETSSFQNGLPIYLIDESIYEHQPSLLVTTIDKFAPIPFCTEMFKIFGKSSQEYENDKTPPNLIIQSEVPAISGPLGRLVGDYEVLIDKLSNNKGIPAKIIVSTEDVREAGKQLKSLYGRECTIFPPLEISHDSYFFPIIKNFDVRGLKIMFITFCKFYVKEFADCHHGDKFDKDNPVIYKVKDFIISYIKRADSQRASVAEKEINRIIDEWQKAARSI